MKQYLKLLLQREARELMGRHFGNLWLLTLMLVATFASIAFSEGSMAYLEDKMSDPFTNWVNITRSTDDNRISDEEFNAFRDSLYAESYKSRYDYSGVLISTYRFYNMVGASGADYPVSARFFEHLNSPLIHAVLKPGNVVDGCKVDSSLLQNETMGFIMTIGAAKKLGYDERHLPAYIDVLKVNEGADSLGLAMFAADEKYLPVSLPVLAVVRRLPGNVQMISGTYLFEQLENGSGTLAFDFKEHKDDYLRQLAFYVSDSVEAAFREYVPTVIPDSLRSSLNFVENNDLYQSMRTWKPGNIIEVSVGDGSTPLLTLQSIANAVAQQFQDHAQVCRVFRLKTGESETIGSQFLSVEFRSLKHIHEFEAYANSHKIQLEMEQVHSKENFEAVASMAHILSAAMVIFSIVCIIMFMVNMLQGYFQKVKRNIGTFKAFGMKGYELILIYVLMLVAIVCVTVLLALLITWGLQLSLDAVGIGKGGFNYLSLWNPTTYIAAAVILLSTIFTVVFVMSRMLSQTPGDLIYDRN